jgi:hypothetical protein
VPDAIRARRTLTTYVAFVGHARSGSTLLGALLDAHERTSIAHEADALGLWGAGVSVNELFAHLLRRAAWFHDEVGCQWAGYDYLVPGGWQGAHRDLLAIGDKHAGRTTTHLQRDPDLLRDLGARAGLDVRVVNVSRNPYDNFATIIREHEARYGPPDRAAELSRFVARCETIDRLATDPAQPRMLTIGNSALIADPEATLTELARFVGVAPDVGWLAACSNRLFRDPSRSGASFDWLGGERDTIGDLVARLGYLAPYR